MHTCCYIWALAVKCQFDLLSGFVTMSPGVAQLGALSYFAKSK